MPEAIRARGLRHCRPDGTPTLDRVDLDVAPGERLAVIGPAGSGKTALALILAGLLDRAGGELSVAGLAVGRFSARELRARVGVVLQDPGDQLFMPSAGEEAVLGASTGGLPPLAARIRAEAALGVLGMGWAFDRPTRPLSDDERRRVAVAAVLAGRPEVVVVDEPGAGLERRSWSEVAGLLREVPAAVVVMTRDPRLAAEVCDRAVALSGGRVVADLPLQELVARRRAAGVLPATG